MMTHPGSGHTSMPWDDSGWNMWEVVSSTSLGLVPIVADMLAFECANAPHGTLVQRAADALHGILLALLRQSAVLCTCTQEVC